MFLYTATKGRTEEDVIQLRFPRLSIYRPAILMGEREEPRLMEQLGVSIIVPVWNLFSPNSAGVHATQLARAMVRNCALPPTPTLVAPSDKDEAIVEVLDNRTIIRLAPAEQS